MASYTLEIKYGINQAPVTRIQLGASVPPSYSANDIIRSPQGGLFAIRHVVHAFVNRSGGPDFIVSLIVSPYTGAAKLDSDQVSEEDVATWNS